MAIYSSPFFIGSLVKVTLATELGNEFFQAKQINSSEWKAILHSPLATVQHNDIGLVLGSLKETVWSAPEHVDRTVVLHNAQIVAIPTLLLIKVSS